MLRFVLLVAISALIITIDNVYIFNEDLLINLYSGKYSESEIRKVIEGKEQWRWVQYALLPCIYFLKSLIVMLCLSTGLLVYSKSIKFRELFDISVTAQFVTLLPSIIFVVGYFFFSEKFSVESIENFSQLSLLSLSESVSLEQWEKFLLRKISLLEPLFILVLAFGMSLHYQQKISESLKIVLVSYGAALSIWMLIGTFLTLTYA